MTGSAYVISSVLSNGMLLATMCWVTVSYARALRDQYSTIHPRVLYGIWMLWGIGILSMVIYFLAIGYQNVVWSFVDMVMNIASIVVSIYISEHIIPPLPDEQGVVVDVAASDVLVEKLQPDYAQSLLRECESKRLFCNPDLSLTELALALGTNRTYLSKWLADHDTTFYNYINTLRATYAAELLRTTDQPIGDIQIASGFTSKTTFRKYFSQQFGCTPTEYREQDK